MNAAPQTRLFAPAFPEMRLRMALPRWRHRHSAFPFDSPSVQYYYLARNAIHAVARLWDLENQEILFPAYFHGVELEALLAAGAKPKFYPVDCHMRVDVNHIRARISERTRAVYLIHYLGFPGPVEQIMEICRQRNIRLIEDCALALLSRCGDRPLGSFGDASVFCLYKTLPVPNGGALWLKDPESGRPPEPAPPSLASTLAYSATTIWRDLGFDTGGRLHRVLQKTRNLAKSKSDALGVVGVGTAHFEPSHADLAMSRVCSWIVSGQDFPAIVERRRQNYLQLLKRLRYISHPVFDGLPSGVCPLSYPLSTHRKLAVLERLLARGVDAVNLWSRASAVVPAGQFPEAEALRSTILELPCHQDLTPQDIDWIAGQVCTVLRETAV